MSHRRQEKIGWIGGWLGGFCWVVPLAVILLARGDVVRGTLGLAISVVACAAIWLFAPWRNPQSTFRRLLIPVYLLALCSFAWGIWAFGGPRQIGLNGWWSLMTVLPLSLPLWIGGSRRWQDGDRPHAG